MTTNTPAVCVVPAADIDNPALLAAHGKAAAREEARRLGMLPDGPPVETSRVPLVSVKPDNGTRRYVEASDDNPVPPAGPDAWGIYWDCPVKPRPVIGAGSVAGVLDTVTNTVEVKVPEHLHADGGWLPVLHNLDTEHVHTRGEAADGTARPPLMTFSPNRAEAEVCVIPDTAIIFLTPLPDDEAGPPLEEGQ